MLIPIANEAGARVSPLLLQTSTDINYYLVSAVAYFGEGPGLLASLSHIFLLGDVSGTPVFAPPAFPFLLHLFDYGAGSTLALSVLYLGLGIAFASAWIWWLARQGLALPLLCLFAILPNAIWFSISISSDLLFAVVFAFFYVVYFRQGLSPRRVHLWFVFVVLMVVTRPNSLSILIFVILDLLFLARAERVVRIWGVALASLMLLIAGIFYYPSFAGYMVTPGRIVFFGHLTSAYVDGIYESLPNWLDLPLSWLSLAAAKILYLVGLRPSFADVSLEFVLLRGLAGLITLPGLLYFFFAADNRHRLLMALFLAPILTGVAQDRYVLPVQAILFYYGILAYDAVWRRAVGTGVRELARKPDG